MATRSESSVDMIMIEDAFIDYITKLNTMKAINKQPKNLGTIKIALFVATQVPALKGSEMWHRCNDLLNWINQFNENDSVIISNDANITITFTED